MLKKSRKSSGPRKKARLFKGKIGSGTNKSFRSKAGFKNGFIIFK